MGGEIYTVISRLFVSSRLLLLRFLCSLRVQRSGNLILLGYFICQSQSRFANWLIGFTRICYLSIARISTIFATHIVAIVFR